MSTTCAPYPRFQISGVNLGLYVFDVNPSTYDVYPSRNPQVYKTILDFDPTIDQDYNKIEENLSWTRMPEQMWNDLEPYYRKNTDGRSEAIYFWDGAIGRFNGEQIRVGEFISQAQAGIDPIDRFGVSMKIRQVF